MCIFCGNPGVQHGGEDGFWSFVVTMSPLILYMPDA
jgi:hypothetical protein